VTILSKFKIQYHDALVAGDGSGGISAAILRLSPLTRLIFNSLLTLDKVDLRGTAPSPPSALVSLGRMGERCVNLMNVWENPSDLTEDGTWFYFSSLKEEHSLKVDLVVIDAEISEISQVAMLEKKIETHVFPLLSRKGTMIYKTYMDRLFDLNLKTLETLGGLFKKLELGFTEITSSHIQKQGSHSKRPNAVRFDPGDNSLKCLQSRSRSSTRMQRNTRNVGSRRRSPISLESGSYCSCI